MSEKQVRDYDKFMLRFPDGMREAIAERAKRNGRSMNAEIVRILQDSLESGDSGSAILSDIGIKQLHKILDKVIEESLINKKPT